jgi:phosphatidylinositol glycan class V
MLDAVTSLWTHPLQRPKACLIVTFLAWKLLLFLVAVASPGPGYDTSTFLSTSSPSYVLGKFVRWDAIYFTQIARRGYVFEQEWAFGWGFTRILAAAGRGRNLQCKLLTQD